MTPIGFITGAAAGAVGGWALQRRALDEARETARRDREALEKSLADARRHAVEVESQYEAARAELTANAGLADEVASLRRAAAVTLEEATARAKDELRASVEREARAQVDRLLAEARAQADRLIAEARSEVERLTGENVRRQKELASRDEILARRELAMTERDQQLGRRDEELSRRERAVIDRERAVGEREKSAERLVEERAAAVEAVKKSEQVALERVASLTAEEAQRQVIDGVLDEARRTAAREARHIEEVAREEAEKRAKRVVGIAVQRYAGEYAGERAVTSVHLPNDELKGRIIGREGRNIRAFQETTGCDLVIDDTPETIVVSSFDPVRREVARITLERLIQDGRIHPTKIEEFFHKAKDDVDRAIREAGEAAALELGVGRLHPDLNRVVGQLQYRYSYAQNILRHSVEVGFMAGLLAQEMGVNPRLAKRAGLLHDIGKAMTHEVEGGHAVVGAQLARKAGEDEMVVNAIAAHHDDEPAKSLLAHITAAADAISGARPGARREMLEGYVKRLEDLERICQDFKGVERTFAIQAGREVRVLVEPGEVDDLGALALSRDIARRIETEMAYPGQIKVTVVRETRAVDYAR